MKVVHLIHSLSSYSGAAKQALNLISHLEKNGVHNIIFTRSSNSNHNNQVYISKNNIISRATSFIVLYFKLKPDLVHFHGSDFLILLLCKIFRVKTYWKSTLYGSDDFYTLCKKSRFGHIKRLLIHLIDCNNCLTQQMYNVNKNFLNQKKLVVIPNGVLLPINNTVPQKEKIAIIISAIIPRKSIIDGICFFNTHLKPLNYILYIVGPYVDTLEGFSEEYKELCFKMSSDKVLFLGEIEQENVFKLLEKARFLIHPSKSEGMPNVVLESFAYSVYPIVTSMNGLASEMISHNINGFNMEENDYFDESKFLSPNSKGKELVHSKYSFDVVSKQTHQLYLKLIDK